MTSPQVAWWPQHEFLRSMDELLPASQVDGEEQIKEGSRRAPALT